MRKKLIFYFICCFLAFKAEATHIIGGEITYTRQFQGIYSFKIYLYVDASSSADSEEIELSMGDGSIIKATRISKELLSSGISQLVFTAQHNYSGNGSFRVSFLEANRANSTNMGNSINQAFFLDAFIFVNNANIAQTSPRFIASPIFRASLNQPFSANLTAYDTEGDSLSYTLITPRINANQNAAPYFIPLGFKINPFSGEITWKPQQVGVFNFAFLVGKWRNGTRVGYVTREISVRVDDQMNSGYLAEIQEANIDLSNPNGVRVEVGQSINWKIVFSPNTSASIRMIGLSEVFDNQKVVYENTNPIEGVFNWKPESRHIRRTPYIVVYRTIVNNLELDKTILLYVGSSVLNPDEIVAANENAEFRQRVKAFPNPAKEKIYFKFEFDTQNLQITIFDQLGKLMEVVNNNNESGIELDLKNYQNGVYLYYIRQGKRIIYRGKFIKQ